MSIENLQLTDPIVKNREIVLTAKFTLSTFRQEEAAGAAERSRAARRRRQPIAPTAKPLPPAEHARGREGARRAVAREGRPAQPNATGVDEAKTPAGSAGRLKGGL